MTKFDPIYTCTPHVFMSSKSIPDFQQPSVDTVTFIGAFCRNVNADVLPFDLRREFAFDQHAILMRGHCGGDGFPFDRDLDAVHFGVSGNDKGKIRARCHLGIICFPGEGRRVKAGHNDFEAGISSVGRGTAAICPDSIAVAAGTHRDDEPQNFL